jgi:hypothetical protein
MTIQKAIEHFKEHQRTSVKKRTQNGYRKLIEHLKSAFFDHNVESIKSEELCRFLETTTEGLARSTRRLRYAQLRAVFNFVIDTFEMNNPHSISKCNTRRSDFNWCFKPQTLSGAIVDQ